MTKFKFGKKILFWRENRVKKFSCHTNMFSSHYNFLVKLNFSDRTRILLLQETRVKNFLITLKFWYDEHFSVRRKFLISIFLSHQFFKLNFHVSLKHSKSIHNDISTSRCGDSQDFPQDVPSASPLGHSSGFTLMTSLRKSWLSLPQVVIITQCYFLALTGPKSPFSCHYHHSVLWVCKHL